MYLYKYNNLEHMFHKNLIKKKCKGNESIVVNEPYKCNYK